MNTIRKAPVLAVLVLLTLALPAVVTGATSSHSDSVSLQLTNWTSSVTMPKFDPNWGTLESIEFSLVGYVEGNAGFENLEMGPTTTVTMNFSATIELQRPDESPLVVAAPVVSTVDEVAAYDGAMDFAGTSGRIYSGLSADKTEYVTIANSGELTLFTGSETITLPVVARGSSSTTGSGNIITQFTTSALATVTVTYIYSKP